MAETIGTKRTLTNSVTETLVLKHAGGELHVFMQGNFDSGTIALQGCATETGTFGAVTTIQAGTTYSEAGATDVCYTEVIKLPPGFYKLVGTSLGASASVVVSLNSRA